MENEILQKILMKLDNCATKDDIKEVNTRIDTVEKHLQEMNTRIDNLSSRIDTVEKHLQVMNTRIDTVEKHLQEIKRINLVLEHEHSQKLQVLLDTHCDDHANYVELKMGVSKLHEVTEMHSLQIELLQNKCKS